MWLLELLIGMAVGAFFAVTPLPVFPYMFWVALRAIWASRDMRWGVVIHLLFNLGMVLLPILVIWAAFDISPIAAVGLIATMYFPYWGIPLIDRWRGRHAPKEGGVRDVRTRFRR